MIDKIYQIKLQKIIEESSSLKIKSFYFDYDKSEFNFQAGQYVKLFVDADQNSELFRYMTIASSPTENFLLFTMKIHEESEFKRAIDKIKIGESLSVSEPMGHFVLPDGGDKRIIMLAGGIGATPFRSMVKSALDDISAGFVGHKITLIYSNKTPEHIIYKREWKELQEQNSNFKVIFTITRPQSDWPGGIGRIDDDLVKKIIDYQKSVFYICGKLEMVKDLVLILKNMGIGSENIKFESFTA